MLGGGSEEELVFCTVGSTQAQAGITVTVYVIILNHDLPRRTAAERHDRALGARRRDGWRCLPHLPPRRPWPHAQARRVVLDNLPAHKVAGIRKAIAARRAQLFYLPLYSPDMNPIEMAFAKLKALLRH
ncbi:MAG: hypothetical protein GC201_02320 [Alphaproteobacteria bacterium]|nr:hypothetical protein [Alphaproteobacteria bacterium]